jgi:hypothetical protein
MTGSERRSVTPAGVRGKESTTKNDAPHMVFTVTILDGEEAHHVRRQQAAAIRAVLEWLAAHPADRQQQQPEESE